MSSRSGSSLGPVLTASSSGWSVRSATSRKARKLTRLLFSNMSAPWLYHSSPHHEETVVKGPGVPPLVGVQPAAVVEVEEHAVAQAEAREALVEALHAAGVVYDVAGRLEALQPPDVGARLAQALHPLLVDPEVATAGREVGDVEGRDDDAGHVALARSRKRASAIPRASRPSRRLGSQRAVSSASRSLV